MWPTLRARRPWRRFPVEFPGRYKLYPPLKPRVAHENHHRNPGKYHPKWWIFHGYVSLQECKSCELLVLLSPELFDKMDTLAGMWSRFDSRNDGFGFRLGTHLNARIVPRWWFQIFFYVHPYLGKWSNLTNMFQRGWKPPTRFRLMNSILVQWHWLRQKSGWSLNCDSETWKVTGDPWCYIQQVRFTMLLTLNS